MSLRFSSKRRGTIKVYINGLVHMIKMDATPKYGKLISLWSDSNMSLCQLGHKEIVGLPVLPGKASSLLTEHLITG